MNKQGILHPTAFLKAVFASVLLGLTGLSSLDAQTPLTNANFQSAVNLWFDDEANATATYGHIRDWNVSAVTDMSNAFKDRATFNEDISGWDVSNARHMGFMFDGATAFNQPIGDWNVSAVINMQAMFHGSVFNQPIGALERPPLR